MTMFGRSQSPILLRRIGVTVDMRQTIDNACRSIYKEKKFGLRVVAYSYSSLFMYSISAYSSSEISPEEVSFDAMRSAFTSGIPISEYSSVDIILGSIRYPAPSSAKLMILVHT